MKKEILIAGSIGLFVGLVLVGAYLFSQSASRKVDYVLYNPLIEDFPLTNNSKIKFAASQNHQIVIINPADQSVTNLMQLRVSGRTTPGSVLALLYETGEKSIVTDNQGDFETNINLINGENEIKIIALSPAGQVTEKTITVVSSTFEF